MKLAEASGADGGAGEVDLGEIVTDACVAIDASFNAKASRENLNDGSTALVVLVRNSKIFVANVGDSHAVACVDGTAVLLSSPHNPKRPDEEERIISSGGSVVWFGTWRVNGSLAVSRSIGDPQYMGIVIPNPETAEYELTPGHEFLVLASDGVWDVFTHQEAVEYIRSLLVAGMAPHEIASRILDQAGRVRNSTDNATVVIVLLNPPPVDPSATIPDSPITGKFPGLATASRTTHARSHASSLVSPLAPVKE